MTEVVTVQGQPIPALGLGTWRLSGQTARESVERALQLGYRHIDTAAMYGNEAEVGAGIAASGVVRDELFLVTKVSASSLDRRGVARSVATSLRALGTYIDLLLIHWPSRQVPLAETIGAMQSHQEDGDVRHLGVSNFSLEGLRQARELAPILTNQVRLHPFVDQDELVAYAAGEDLAITAYSPLAKGRVTQDETLQEIAAHHGCTPAQVALRWLLDKPGVVVIPKAAREAHQRENLQALRLELTDRDRARIEALG